MISLIAFTTMLIDHIGLLLFPDEFFLRVIGRAAFPLFAVMIGRGSFYTSDSLSYISRLLILAIVSQIPFIFAVTPDRLNVVFTLVLGLSLWHLFIKQDFSALFILFVITLLVPVDYGFTGVFFVAFCCAAYCYCIPLHSLFWVFVAWPDAVSLFVGLIFLLLFWFVPFPGVSCMRSRLWYGFYPIHLLLLYLISLCY